MSPELWARVVGAAVLAGVTACAPSATDEASASTPTCGPSSAVVAHVIDGDTVQLESGEKVRYLLVDTPEVSGDTQECYGDEARAFNRSLVEGKRVSLTYEAECEDRYGRLLAWVSLEGRDVNRILLERGFGCLLFIPPNGRARHQELESVEAEARAAGRGLWGYCSSRPCSR